MTPDKIAAVLDAHAKWLRGEDMGSRANLERANLEGANLDFASWPLWCGSFYVIADERLAAQLAYHFCRIEFQKCPDAIEAQAALASLANRFHRAGECGRIPE